MSTSICDLEMFMNVSGTVDIPIVSHVAHAHVKVNGTATVTSSEIEDGCIFFLMLQQDATGGHTVTFDTMFEFENGTMPTLTTTANAFDTFIFGVMNGKIHHHSFTKDVK